MAGEIQLNSVSLATESSGTVTLNSSTDIKGCLNASGSAPIYACRAWINFDGTSGSIGTGRASGNVSGVTDNGTGDYTVNFATAMPDANYAVFMMQATTTNGANQLINAQTSSSCSIETRNTSETKGDCARVTLGVFR